MYLFTHVFEHICCCNWHLKALVVTDGVRPECIFSASGKYLHLEFELIITSQRLMHMSGHYYRSVGVGEDKSSKTNVQAPPSRLHLLLYLSYLSVSCRVTSQKLSSDCSKCTA